MEESGQTQFNFRLKPLPAMFLIIQIILLILLIISVPKLFQDEKIADTPAEGLSVKMVNASDVIPEDYSGWTKMVEWALFDTVSNNAGDKKFSKDVSVFIREGSVRSREFEQAGINYVRAIIDVPEIEQSYEFFLKYPNNPEAVNAVEYGNPSAAKPYSILCIEDKKDIIYPDFDCKDSPEYFNRQKIVSGMLGYFFFDYFSPYLSFDGDNTVIISPSVTYDNDEATKTKYIEEVKAAIESLGVSPDDFRYYVRTAADVDYYN